MMRAFEKYLVPTQLLARLWTWFDFYSTYFTISFQRVLFTCPVHLSQSNLFLKTDRNDSHNKTSLWRVLKYFFQLFSFVLQHHFVGPVFLPSKLLWLFCHYEDQSKRTLSTCLPEDLLHQNQLRSKDLFFLFVSGGFLIHCVQLLAW